MGKDQKKIPGSEFFKSLGKLESMANDQTKEEKEQMKKSQLFHTPSNSEQDGWGNGDTEKYSDKWDDNIKEDGTDYGAVRKSIADKVLKGIALTPEEVAILKSDVEKAAGKPVPPMRFSMEKAKDEDDEDKPSKEEKEHLSAKSIEKSIKENDVIQNGLEVSEFLQEFVKSFTDALDKLEDRTTKAIEEAANGILGQVGEYLDVRFSEQSEFNKSLADAVVNIGHGVAGAIDQQSELFNMPAHAPKSVQSAPINKSLDYSNDAMLKSMKLDILCDLVEKGKLNPVEVTKFEVTGQIRPDLDAQITKYIESNNNQ